MTIAAASAGFTWLVALGAAVGMGLALWKTQREASQHPRQTPPYARVVQCGMWMLLLALVGSRAGYAAAHWEAFQGDWLALVRPPLGGLAWPGALAGAGLALLLAGRLPDGARCADLLAPLLGLVSVAVWLGCGQAACAYGHSAAVDWLPPVQDEWGLAAVRFPLPYLGALLTTGLLALAESISPRLQTPGRAAVWFFGGLTGLTTGLSFLRADPGPYLNGLRLDTWAGLALSALALLAILGHTLALRSAHRRAAH